MTALHICYQSVLEPLTQTQVLPYLHGLAKAGHRVVLLTFEPRRLTTAETRNGQQSLAARGIVWHWRRYHKRPTLPATAWDALVGVLTAWWLVRRHKVRLVHARSHVPGAMALILKHLTGAKLLLDVRGLMAEEYVDAGVWPANGLLFRITKRLERALFGAADAIVVLTERAKEHFLECYPRETANKPLITIPCCVDLRPRTNDSRTLRSQPNGPKTMVYVGKLGGWYMTDAMADFMATAIRMIPGLRWQVWTQSDPRPLRQLLAQRGVHGKVAINSSPPDELPARLRGAMAGLSLRAPGRSARAASPTKVGEYLAAGLPVIANVGVGDTDALLSGQSAPDHAPVGVLVRQFSDDAYREALRELITLRHDPHLSRQCQKAAQRHFDLERVGWARYRQIYDNLIGTPTESQ
ncbi:MAG: hypothetical protein A2V70_04530 [Planctomycetes bacterium RBG_13_63_9]|nr:MAG: hypothetical protein A2V70_04530 [Planctomycetes bacterium RBG_13_63_9]